MSAREIVVDLRLQELTLLEDGRVRCAFPVSSAANGPGEQMGSGCTPRGLHVARMLIGHGLPSGSVFVARRATGEVYSDQLGLQYPGRDWMLSRIVWLQGCEPERNRFGDVDTLRRFIYIHGCPDTEPMGTPASRGCIRMRNDDIIALFDQLAPGISVRIHE
ncbi:L,D-transpeptidase [Pararobbsia silviterrae]|uniref:L,D-transpeptidase n=1 Tax=Pararobbsia silviterrae TaxID=1792498 RepID=A0A494XNF6_9BURK|nr:L,D-transpeptidase [Pararobbsia silviterrae]RKP49649.1 L,D-transpeptidase [Pararobbsia silviterrae]